jgi:hypothetical protein
VTDTSFEPIDDLFREIRLTLPLVRNNDPETGDKLKGLVSQLELWVESLVANSLKLDGLETNLQRRRELAKILLESLAKKSKIGSDSLQATSGEQSF